MFDHSKKYWFVGGLVVYSFLNILILNGDRLYAVEVSVHFLLFVIAYLCLGIWHANLFIEKKIQNRVSGIHPLITQFVCSVIALMLLSVLSVLLTFWLLGDPFSYVQQNVLLTAGFAFRVNLFLNTVNAVYFYNSRFKEKELESERLKSASLTAQYFNLQNQINPHFLFNNLNTLAALIREDRDKAQYFLNKLADIYRYLLKTRNEELVSLCEELQFLDGYLELLSIRFGKGLSINFIKGVEVHKNQMIPPTVLQLLVENAVKHNSFTESQPIDVMVKVLDNQVIVRNTLRLKKVKEDSFTVGLKNIKQRYEFFHREVRIEQTPHAFTVCVPVIHANHEIINTRR